MPHLKSLLVDGASAVEVALKAAQLVEQLPKKWLKDGIANMVPTFVALSKSIRDANPQADAATSINQVLSALQVV